MKLFFVLLAVFSLYFGYSQDSLASPVNYSEVIKVDTSLSVNELYLRARAWFAESYRSAKDVIQMDDKDAGKIIGKGNIRYSSKIFVGSAGTSGWIDYTIAIQVRDGRYKYEITNFYHEGTRVEGNTAFSFGLITTSEESALRKGGWSQGWRNKVWNDIKVTIKKRATSIIESLTIAMGKPAKNNETNW